MTVTDVRARVLRAPLTTPVRMAHGTMRERVTVLVEVVTDAGLTGVGESWVNFPAWAACERRATVEEGVRPLLLGQDPLDRATCWRTLTAALVPLGRQWGAPGPVMQALSAVDVALWDLAGQAVAQPISALLGAPTGRRVPCYASGVGPTRAVEEACRAVEAGFAGVKLKVGFGGAVDRRNVAEVRRAVGDDVTVLVDANQAWDVEQAVEMARFLADHGVGWLEEPVPTTEPALLAAVARQSPVPIAAGENIYGREGFQRFAEAGAFAVAQPDVTKTGGITEALAVAALLAPRGIALAPHFYGGAVGAAATLHFFAAAPGGWWVEWDIRPNPLRDALLANSWELAGGYVRVPDQGPGLGITIDPRALQAFAEA